MPASPTDSAMYRNLFGDDQAAALFTDSAEVRAMLLVEGALARVQGALGLIPPDAAAFIDRAALEVQIDPAALGLETARNGVPVPALLAAFRKAAGAPTLLHYLHWGATSQDIMDTALALRLRRLLQIWDTRLVTLTGQLAELATTHADLPMAARTYGQHATPTTFGAVVAGWGWPILSWQNDLPPLRTALLRVSLSGAAGTLSAMGDHGPAVRAGLAQALNLADPGHSWHADRSGIARLAGFAAGLAGSLGKLGEDLILLTQSGIAEVTLSGAGGSSTMPQKENPVAPSALAALSRHVIGLSATLQGAALHRQQRDGAAWFTEWLTLPQLCLSTSRMLSLACECLTALRPDPAAMARPLTTGAGLIHAEALTFALAQTMPRPEAQTLVATLCQTALTTGTPLATLVAEHFPTLPWPPAAPTGTAPAEARAFAAQARLADPPLVQP
jgi:3-carboxy-cis,cis-muconate cycloisomerase